MLVQSAPRERGSFGEILSHEVRERVKPLVSELAQGGAWEFGIRGDPARGVSLNWDAYGHGTDMHSGEFLAVIQVRQTRWYGYGNSSRKVYFLLGRNEDGTAFAHAVESRVVHAAIAAGRDVIKSCQDWIFGHDYGQVVRQGDIALVPATKKSAVPNDIRTMSLGTDGSHLLEADVIHQSGSCVYALNPVLTHNVHPSVRAHGWHKVIVGRRAPIKWDFTEKSMVVD